MLPQIFYNIHCLSSTRVAGNHYNSSKISTRWQQCHINSTRELMSHTPKTFQEIHIYFTKVKNPPDVFCTHIFFASKTILIFGGLFLNRLSGILRFDINWLRVPTTDFGGKKCRTRRDNPNSSKISWKSRKKPPKGHTKNGPIVFCTISNEGICHILS